jgi:hypothetical protein
VTNNTTDDFAKPLIRVLESLPKPKDSSNTPLFPEAHATNQRNIHSGTLSNQAYEIRRVFEAYVSGRLDSLKQKVA